jgi:hypothetical protein
MSGMSAEGYLREQLKPIVERLGKRLLEIAEEEGLDPEELFRAYEEGLRLLAGLGEGEGR